MYMLIRVFICMYVMHAYIYNVVRLTTPPKCTYRLERSARAGTLSSLPPAQSLPSISPSSPLSPLSQSSQHSLDSVPHRTATATVEDGNALKEGKPLAVVVVRTSQSEPQVHNILEDRNERYPTMYRMSQSCEDVKSDGVCSDDVHCGSSAHGEMKDCGERDRDCAWESHKDENVCVEESSDVENGCADLKVGRDAAASGEENQSLPSSQTRGETRIELEDVKRMYMYVHVQLIYLPFTPYYSLSLHPLFPSLRTSPFLPFLVLSLSSLQFLPSVSTSSEHWPHCMVSKVQSNGSETHVHDFPFLAGHDVSSHSTTHVCNLCNGTRQYIAI